MNPVAVAGIGLCTAQGSAADIRAGSPLAPPRALPWSPSPRATCTVGFAARGIDPLLRGSARWQALARAALGELEGRRDVPIIVASCNGGADEDEVAWRSAFASLGFDAPVASAACASGLHALWLALTRIEAGEQEVIVLAVDVLSRANHDNFEVLRVLSMEPAPWQPTSSGFVPGEAAVALRLVRACEGDGLARVSIPALAHDRDAVDALAEVLSAVPARDAAAIIGQGTGPVATDERELAALRSVVGEHVPLATALTSFGHTVGASSLLSVALAALDVRPMLTDHRVAVDGRRLGTATGTTLVACRALGGACAALTVGSQTSRSRPVVPTTWSTASPPPALRIPLLRTIADEALAHRPAVPPGALIVRLDEPLVPPADASIGGRLLPSVALEITPGFVAQLVARAWGYGGPALCLVGGSDDAWLPTLAACRRVHGTVLVLHVHGRGFGWIA
ncbi:MAG: hypothetical protein H0T42_17690 [Deltaproteobacteria bacterium]|nr:hypothetical protein [Deltaproteobacteria bacterium]